MIAAPVVSKARVWVVEPETGSVPEEVADPLVEGTFWPTWRVKLKVWPSPVMVTDRSPVVRVVGVKDQLPEASVVVV